MILRNMLVGVSFGSASIAKLEQTHDISSCCHAGWCKSTSKKHLRPVSLEKREQTHGISSCGLEDDFKRTAKKHLRPQPRLNQQRKEAHAASRTGYPSIKVPAVSTSLIPPYPWRRTLEHNRWLGAVSGSHHHVVCAVSFPHCFFFLT